MSPFFTSSHWLEPALPGARLFSKAGWMALFILFFAAFYLLHGPRITPDPESPARFDLLAGDEPHYLILTHSLVTDSDLNLFNNMRNEDYRLFYTGSVPDYRGGFADFWKGIVRGRLKRVPDEYWRTRLYSICSPGLPLLLAPSYATGLHWGGRVRYTVTLFLHALSAALGLLMVWLAWRTCRIRSWALFIGASLALSGPLVFYSMSVYTDLPGALCLAGCVAILAAWPLQGVRARTAALLAIGLLAGFMVWLHTKFWMHFFCVGVLAAGIFHRRGAPGRQILFLLAPALALAAGMATYYWFLFGVPYPVRTYPPFEVRQALLSGWPGLWLDQRHGLLWYLPLAVFVFPGALRLARQRDGFGLGVCALLLLHWIATGLFSDWTGGRCPPMRYWVPAIPLFAIPLAACAGPSVPRAFRALLALAALAGVGLGVFGMAHPRRLYDYAHPLFSYTFGAWYKKAAPLMDGAWPAVNTAGVLASLVLVSVLCVWIWNPKKNSTTKACE